MLVTPGLSVIITAMIRSRKIFRRLLNYVIYRLSATTQILVFVFIAVIFLTEFDDRTAFEVPAIVLVLITIINDGTIMTIAYDVRLLFLLFPIFSCSCWPQVRILNLCCFASLPYLFVN